MLHKYTNTFLSDAGYAMLEVYPYIKQTKTKTKSVDCANGMRSHITNSSQLISPRQTAMYRERSS